MKKSKLLTSLVGLGAVAAVAAPLLSLSSCNLKNKTDFAAKANESLKEDYVFWNRDDVKKINTNYSVDLINFNGGEEVDISLASAKDLAGQELAFAFEITGETHIVVDAENPSIPFGVTFADKYSEMLRAYRTVISFTLKLDVKYKDKEDAEKTTTLVTDDAFTLNILKATSKDNFVYRKDTKEIVRWKVGGDYEECDIFMLPEDATAIVEGAFWNLEAGVTLIPDNMKYLVLDPTPETPSNLKRIYARAFKQAPFTGDCIIPEGVEEIRDEAFYGVPFTGDYKLPSSLIVIGEGKRPYIGHTFAENDKCQGQLIIPKDSKICEFGPSAFDGTSISGEAYIPDPFTSHDYNLSKRVFAETNITSVSLPSVYNFSHEEPDGPQTFADCIYVNHIDLTRVDDEDAPLLKAAPTLFQNCGSDDSVEYVTVVFNKIFENTELAQTFKSVLVADGLPEAKIFIDFAEKI